MFEKHLNYAYLIGGVVKPGRDSSGKKRARLSQHKTDAKKAAAFYNSSTPIEVKTLWEAFCDSVEESQYVEDVLKRHLADHLRYGAEYFDANEEVIELFRKLQRTPAIHQTWLRDFRVDLYRRERNVYGELPAGPNNDFVNAIFQAIRESENNSLTADDCEKILCADLPTDVIEDFHSTWNDLIRIKTILVARVNNVTGQIWYKL